MSLSITSLKSHLSEFVSATQADEKLLASFLHYVEGKVAQEAAAVSLLVSHGFKVETPAEVESDVDSFAEPVIQVVEAVIAHTPVVTPTPVEETVTESPIEAAPAQVADSAVPSQPVSTPDTVGDTTVLTTQDVAALTPEPTSITAEVVTPTPAQ